MLAGRTASSIRLAIALGRRTGRHWFHLNPMVALFASWFPALNAAPVRHRVPVLPEGRAVPRIIHQTFRSPQVPPLLEEQIRALRERNPDFEYRFYDDAAIVDFIRTNYGSEILESYQRIDPEYGAARADLFRYLLLYHAGGVYLDIKSSFSRPLRDVIEPGDRFLLSQWRNHPDGPFDGFGDFPELRAIPGGEFQQCFIIASPGHPFLRAVIESVLQNIDRYNPVLHGVGFLGVVRTTGPIAYTLAIAPLLGAHPHRVVSSEFDLGFVYSGVPGGELAHRDLSPPHYSQRSGSVIRTTGVLIPPLLVVANRLRWLGSLLGRVARMRPGPWRAWRARRQARQQR